MKKILNYSDWVNKINTSDWETPDKVIDPSNDDWYPQKMWKDYTDKKIGNK